MSIHQAAPRRPSSVNFCNIRRAERKFQSFKFFRKHQNKTTIKPLPTHACCGASFYNSFWESIPSRVWYSQDFRSSFLRRIRRLWRPSNRKISRIPSRSTLSNAGKGHSLWKTKHWINHSGTGRDLHPPDVTGPAPRNATQEATETVCQRSLPGFSELMRAVSIAKVSTANLLRQTAGICGASLVFNLAGSPKAIAECLDHILPSITWLAGGSKQVKLKPEFHPKVCMCQECRIINYRRQPKDSEFCCLAWKRRSSEGRNALRSCERRNARDPFLCLPTCQRRLCTQFVRQFRATMRLLRTTLTLSVFRCCSV